MSEQALEIELLERGEGDHHQTLCLGTKLDGWRGRMVKPLQRGEGACHETQRGAHRRPELGDLGVVKAIIYKV